MFRRRHQQTPPRVLTAPQREARDRLVAALERIDADDEVLAIARGDSADPAPRT